MIKGKISDNNEPLISLKLKGATRSHKVLAIIDTGFNGYLAVPRNIIMGQGWQLIGSEKYEVATGKLEVFDVFLGEIEWGKKSKSVYAMVTDSQDILIGTKLLKDSTLIINFPAKKVRITEDFELTLKLYRDGWKVVYTPYIQAPSECVSTLKRLV